MKISCQAGDFAHRVVAGTSLIEIRSAGVGVWIEISFGTSQNPRLRREISRMPRDRKLVDYAEMANYLDFRLVTV